MSFNLVYLDRIDIEDKDAGLDEPSGLVLTEDGQGFWTVSDDTKAVFRLDLDGALDASRSFEIEKDGLEGITIHPDGRSLFAVREDDNSILQLDIEDRREVRTFQLRVMQGWDSIAAFFEQGGSNKGLEGIAWNLDTDRPVVLKEGEPGLLVELSSSFEQIMGHVVLDQARGFVDPGLPHDPGVPADKVDFSDICFDASRKAYWIVSDKAKRVYLYDPQSNRVVHSAPLGYAKNGKYREVGKAEGVSYDHETSQLYVVSDEEAKLYVFAVRP